MWEKMVKENRFLLSILVALLIVVVVIIFNFYSFSNIELLVINQIKENQYTKTEFAADQIASHILQVKDELITLTKFPEIDALNINNCYGEKTIIHKEFQGKIRSVLRVDSSGNVIECSSPIYGDYIGLNVANKDYFRVPKETEEPYITGIVRQGTSQQIIITAPLFETTEYTPYPNFIAEFKGILMSFIELNQLYNLYIYPILGDETSYFLLVNLDDGTTLIKSEEIPAFDELRKELPNKTRGGVVANLPGQGKTIVSSSDMLLGNERWRLILLTPLSNVGTPIHSVQQRHLFSLVFVIFIFLGTFSYMISLYRSKEQVSLQLEKANVTLEKFGINIEVEKGLFNQADISLEPHKLYLLKEDDENQAHELFLSTLNSGYAGLGIVREDPNLLKKRYNLQKTSFIWLTNAEVSNAAAETNIANLYTISEAFIKESPKSAILLERLDYIISQNSFDEVLKYLQKMRDLALENDCIIIISVNPLLMSENNFRAVQAETIDLYGRHLTMKVNLSKIERGILEFVNEMNVNNKMISYKDITQRFTITKPTTRVKIRNLKSLGLLQIERKGRHKCLKITSAGRRILK